jgi:uncharacterized membrane protein
MSQELPHEFLSSLRTSRIEALSDGIFAIAMTLLILQIEVPDLHGSQVEELRLLLRLWPRFLSYGVGFTVLGVYWMGQHIQFHLIRRADQALLWLTMLFLMLVAAIPFSAKLIGGYVHVQPIVAFYGCHLIAISLVHCAIWRHATRNRRLVEDRLSLEVIQLQTLFALIPPGIYLVAIALSFLSTLVSVIVYAIVPAVYVVVPHFLSRHRRQRT